MKYDYVNKKYIKLIFYNKRECQYILKLRVSLLGLYYQKTMVMSITKISFVNKKISFLDY